MKVILPGRIAPFVLQKYGTVTIRQWWDVHVHRDPFNSYLYGLDSGARFGGSCGGGGLFEYDKAFPKRIPAEAKYTTSIEYMYMYNTVQTWHRVWYGVGTYSGTALEVVASDLVGS